MNSDIFTFKWELWEQAYRNSLNSFWNRGLHTDVTIVCDGEYFQVHRIVLSTCSEYFQEILEKSCKFPSPVIIIIIDIKPCNLLKILKFIYTGEIQVEKSELTGLAKAAKSLKIKGLDLLNEYNVVNKKNKRKRALFTDDDCLINEEKESKDTGSVLITEKHSAKEESVINKKKTMFGNNNIPNSEINNRFNGVKTFPSLDTPNAEHFPILNSPYTDTGHSTTYNEEINDIEIKDEFQDSVNIEKIACTEHFSKTNEKISTWVPEISTTLLENQTDVLSFPLKISDVQSLVIPKTLPSLMISKVPTPLKTSKVKPHIKIPNIPTTSGQQEFEDFVKETSEEKDAELTNYENNDSHENIEVCKEINIAYERPSHTLLADSCMDTSFCDECSFNTRDKKKFEDHKFLHILNTKKPPKRDVIYSFNNLGKKRLNQKYLHLPPKKCGMCDFECVSSSSMSQHKRMHA